MAVVDKYVNSNIESGYMEKAALVNGSQVLSLTAICEVAAADSDGSIYRLAKGLGSNLIPVQILINNDAITGATDYDLGLYKVDSTVKDKDIFADGMNLSGAAALGSEVQGMSNVDIANFGKMLYEYAGDTIETKQSAYDLCLTANTVGSAAGTILVRALFARG